MAIVDSVESTTPPINKPPWYVTLISSFVILVQFLTHRHTFSCQKLPWNLTWRHLQRTKTLRLTEIRIHTGTWRIMRDPYGKGISFRFHHKKWIGESTGEVGIGYDHNYVLDCPDHVKDDASEQVVLHGCGLGN
uniref:Uncharacterized protein n=1 Tax=Brassica oleracea TaxID=3712 RepID=A0A3P6FT13_BRAOL|nr:unnamed protein product [Brassica oleracea]